MPAVQCPNPNPKPPFESHPEPPALSPRPCRGEALESQKAVEVMEAAVAERDAEKLAGLLEAQKQKGPGLPGGQKPFEPVFEGQALRGPSCSNLAGTPA